MKVLVTGGAGYIGSHTAVELLKAGHEVTIVDNLSNSSASVIERIEEITSKKPSFIQADVTDAVQLSTVFNQRSFDAVIHFAALKAVGESVQKPLEYYQNNLGGLLTILGCVEEHLIPSFIFSSSATVYGNPSEIPLKETSPVGDGITNPYGQTKYMGEQIIRDFTATQPKLSATLLRYFNPIGAHESGLIGEDPSDTPNNLMPYISQVAIGTLKELQVFGNDYETPDGTGIRDYIHVVDLAKGHVAALEKARPGIQTYNLGTGKGYSVLEVIAAFELVSGRQIPYHFAKRRPGDVAECYADPAKAEQELGWRATKDLAAMCEDAWRWQQHNLKR